MDTLSFSDTAEKDAAVSSHANIWLVSLLEQLSASLAVMLLLQAEQSVVPDTVKEVKRCPLL